MGRNVMALPRLGMFVLLTEVKEGCGVS
jgi:hypothetical protein